MRGFVPFVTAGAGFLLAVLWFDLMHDVQVLGHRSTELPEEILGSIAGYYRRVTTDARPMNRLVAATMLGTLVAVLLEVVHGSRWVAWASLGSVAAPVLLAALRTVPSAVRLGGAADSVTVQSTLARSILRDHLACFAGMGAVLVLQLGFGR
jgi:hypothetical protein